MQKKLSDNFAIAALLALKSIQHDGNRSALDKIDAADVLAVSNEEKNVTLVLNSVYRKQLNFNRLKAKHDQDLHSLERLDATQYTQAEWNALCDAWGKLMLAQTSQMKTLSEPLNTCFTELDTSLRARSTDVPASCSS